MIIIFTIGFITGLLFYSIISISNIKELKKERDNAESRALTHFRKLFRIEQIINQDEETKEFAVFTVNKVKEVITSDQTKQ